MIIVLKFFMVLSSSAMFQLQNLSMPTDPIQISLINGWNNLSFINLFIRTYIKLQTMMITYQFPPAKPIFLTLIAIAFVVVATVFVDHYSDLFSVFSFLIIIPIARCLGVFLMYPCSFRFTKAEVELRESENFMMCLHSSLLDLESIVEKILHWDLETIQRQYHWLNFQRLSSDLDQYRRIIEKTAERSSGKAVNELYETFKKFDHELKIPIESDRNQGDEISLEKLLSNSQTIFEIKTEQKFHILQKIASTARELSTEIWHQALNIYSNVESEEGGNSESRKSIRKYKTAYWQLFGQKIFKLDSFYAYWDNSYKYTEFSVQTEDKKVLQCAIIHCRKTSQEDYPKKAILFNSPNGAFLQACAISSTYMQFYLKNGLQIILWNYRGYGSSTGTPSIKKSTKDAQLVYHQAQRRFSVKIEVVHGYSIGGPCAVYLAHKYQNQIKLLVADRTFSSIDRVPFGFIDHSLNYCKGAVKLVVQKIVKVLFYSDCIENEKYFQETSCKKVCIWANYDEIIYNNASLKRGLMKKLTQLSKHSSIENTVVAQGQDDKSQTNMSIDTQKEYIETNRQVLETESSLMTKKEILDISKMKKKFSQTLSKIYVNNPTIYRRFAGELRDINGGGIKLPIVGEVELAEFERQHEEYFLGLICFGPAEYQSQKKLLAALSDCAMKIRQEISLMADKEEQKNLETLVETIEFMYNLVKRYYTTLRNRFGFLISTLSGHNGDLQGEYNKLQNILKAALA